MAFSAIVGGETDLFLYDLTTKTERRLTNDAFARRAARVVAGRLRASRSSPTASRPISTTLNPGRYQLATLDVESGRIQPVPTFDAGKSINPQWNADGRQLYFVSDRDGISNVYVVNLDIGRAGAGHQRGRRHERHHGAESGDFGRRRREGAGFSAYESGSYHIYLIDTGETLRPACR